MSLFFLMALFTLACSAQTEQQALASLRQMNRDGALPPESAVAAVESRFAGKRAGSLAKLLRAQIRFENKDFTGAAAILDTDVFRQTTAVADHALWLRGRALQAAGDHARAMTVFARLIDDFPASIRVSEARLLWARSAIDAGNANAVPAHLAELADRHSAEALLLTAKAYEAQGDSAQALKFYRRAYFYGAGTDAAKEAGTKLTSLGQPLIPQNAEEITVRAEKLYDAGKWPDAHAAYLELADKFPASITPQTRVRRIIVTSNLKRMPEAQSAFDSLPQQASKEREEGLYHLTVGYARAKMWPQARSAADQLRQKYPSSPWAPKALADAGAAARDAKNKLEEAYFYRTAVASYPNAVEVASAQFALAWLEHEAGNHARSSQMFIEHLARYVDRDTTNRGKAGYWAARDSEKAGKIADACALYDGVLHRYSANWYGYLAEKRIGALKNGGKCTAGAVGPLTAKAASNLRSVTVAKETATAQALEHAGKSSDLSDVGLFDWAIEELVEAKRTADNSPKINLALARHYRLKGDNVNALLSLAKSYPDYSQMFPEEMGRDEWDIFYPLAHWNEITNWAKNRDLDKYQVAGLIRQESVFNPRARSGANAYGLMQLLIPTARATARKYGSTAPISAETLFQPAINIELGTAYMRDQFDKFGRIEYVAVAYNAGPGRVNPWRASLPAEIDEFVEAIPFRETKGYVQGVIRNSAQYRRLYDDNGNFRPNVGTKPLRAEIDSKTADQIAQEFPDVTLDGRGSE